MRTASSRSSTTLPILSGFEASIAPTREGYSAESTCALRNAASRGVTSSPVDAGIGVANFCEMRFQNTVSWLTAIGNTRIHQLLNITTRRLYRSNEDLLIRRVSLSFAYSGSCAILC